MTPKEKAKELFNIMYSVNDPMGNYPMCFDSAKQCAIIAVDEILLINNVKPYILHTFIIEFFKEVKQEIEKL